MLITKALVFDGAEFLKGESKSAPKGAEGVSKYDTSFRIDSLCALRRRA